MHIFQPKLYQCLVVLLKGFSMVKVSIGSVQRLARNSLFGPPGPQDEMLSHMSHPKLYHCLVVLLKGFPMVKVSIGSVQRPVRNSLFGLPRP
jgi:hypothetical protein